MEGVAVGNPFLFKLLFNIILIITHLCQYGFKMNSIDIPLFKGY
jgi:hypothetical protein